MLQNVLCKTKMNIRLLNYINASDVSGPASWFGPSWLHFMYQRAQPAPQAISRPLNIICSPDLNSAKLPLQVFGLSSCRDKWNSMFQEHKQPWIAFILRKKSDEVLTLRVLVKIWSFQYIRHRYWFISKLDHPSSVSVLLENDRFEHNLLSL